MKFSSTGEYIYKLQSICYVALLFPLIAFTWVRFTPVAMPIDEKWRNYTSDLLNILLCFLPMVILTSVHLWVRRRLITLRQQPTMAERLEGYANMLFIKMGIAVMLALAFLIGDLMLFSDLFLIVFFLLLLYIAIQPPSEERVASALQLKGAERELMLRGKLD